MTNTITINYNKMKNSCSMKSSNNMKNNSSMRNNCMKNS